MFYPHRNDCIFFSCLFLTLYLYTYIYIYGVYIVLDYDSVLMHSLYGDFDAFGTVTKIYLYKFDV